jgi:uncharacterized peroxidase-related enzyme
VSRIPTFASIEASPAAAQPLLEAVKGQLGSVPNMFRVIANSPAALDGYLALNSALARGQLDPRLRTRIAMAVAEFNACDYCLSAHTYIGTNLAKLDPAELAANRDGASNDPRSAVALTFTRKLLAERGRVSASDMDALEAAGYSAAEVIEIIVHVALNTLTNYVNTAVGVDIDFPVVTHRGA